MKKDKTINNLISFLKTDSRVHDRTIVAKIVKRTRQHAYKRSTASFEFIRIKVI